MQRSLTVISKVILCLVSRNKPPRNVLLCLWMRALLLVLVWIHTLPKIAVDTTMVIIRTSVSGAWIVTFSVNDIYAVHVAVFSFQPLLDCTQYLQLTCWNHQLLCKCIAHQKQHVVESALFYCFHLRERHATFKSEMRQQNFWIEVYQ